MAYLDAVQQRKVDNHFGTTQFHRPQCPVCRTTAWRDGPIVDLQTHVRSDGVSPAFALALLPMACRRCGYVMWFDPEPIGLLRSADALKE